MTGKTSEAPRSRLNSLYLSQSPPACKKDREEEGKIQVRRDEPALTGILNFKSADDLSTQWISGFQLWLRIGITW